jgi:hypothetical protein
MSLQEWAARGRLKPHETSKQEISDLFAIVDRDLGDARAEGFRAGRVGHHMTTIAALPLILKTRSKADADYLDACRRKRNLVEYDRTGGATDAEADELVEFSRELRKDVLDWLRARHPGLT